VYVTTAPGKEHLRGEAKNFTSPGGQGARVMRSPYKNAQIRFMLGEPPPNADPENTLCVWLSDSFGEEYLIPDSLFMQGRARAVLSVAFVNGQGTGFERKQGQLYSYRCEPGKLEKLFLYFLEYACAAPLFCYLSGNPLRQKYPDNLPAGLFGVDAVEPIVKVSAPDRIEEGRSGKLTISVHPQNMPAPAITYVVVPDGIIDCSGGAVNALSVGDAVVEAFVSGAPEPCSRFNVRVYRRNRIKSLSISTPSIELPVGGTAQIPVSWEPADADNVNAIQWRCSNNICQAKSGPNGTGLIKAVQQGDSAITVSAEGVSTTMRVKVRPAVREIRLSAESIELKIGRDAQFAASFLPADAYDPQITTTLSDPSVVQFKNGKLLPRRVGETSITVKSATSGVSAVCNVRVMPSQGEESTGAGLTFLALLLMLVSLAVTPFIGIGLAAASALCLFLGPYKKQRRLSVFMIIILLGCAGSIIKAFF
ncbi:MAG: hypothetical protein FWH02_09275, partial [Oscillospiraceae bacterium]|nr:hypothetical protein [Oscillospiraceae bacterium]